jgi:radical SAM protein with 4Fe4S-binding SPASM domain
MLRLIKDKYGFKSAFNDQNGDYVRSGILDEKGFDTGKEPFRSEFPQLLDIGIMGHCIHGLSGLCQKCGVQCYQSGNTKNEPNMSLFDYKNIISQCKDKVFQVALGGRGDPDCHSDFEEILRVTRGYGIVPNVTTSGYGLTHNSVKAMAKYCGAVAVSYYKTPYTYKAIEMLLNEGITTNIHFVLGKNSIDEAIWLLKGNIPKGIEKVVFLLHKPIGLGDEERVLEFDERLSAFFSLFVLPQNAERLGFDSCMVPGIISHCPEILKESYDACESGRFSCYIGADMLMSPCSFDKSEKNALSLKKYTIQEVFDSEIFENFRNAFLEKCPHCVHRELCLGGCPIVPQIRLCKEKTTI